ncbi:DNA-binding protein [Sphingomonas kyeonggiensis]|uniref:DNA-binding protein n=1 Tax=Sphingomonas kyeonggiensis TaxID=1268553 RepID=UPI00358FDF02
MFDPGATPDDIAVRAGRVRARLAAEGVNVSEWARGRGFNPRLVHAILDGGRPCRRGQSHKIAVALGIKDGAA